MGNEVSYKDSGVDIDEGNLFVNKIKLLIASTLNKNVPENIGGFAGFYSLSDFKDMSSPMLVASTDGVGTKLKVAFMMEKFDTVGIDLVAMCVNDLIVTGARPLFFLDYIATGSLNAEKMTDVMKGITDGCVDAETAVIGGETAEMPGMYGKGEFDLAGFSVGIVDKAKIINGKDIKNGDVIIGLPSSGFHSNGYSLLRKIIFDKLGKKTTDIAYDNVSIGEMLLTPTKIYVRQILSVIDKGFHIKGMVHITGGGFYENIPRVLPECHGADIYPDRFPTLACYDYIKNLSIIEDSELYRVFNMGIGYIIVCSRDEATGIISHLNDMSITSYEIGEITDTGKVRIKGVDF